MMAMFASCEGLDIPGLEGGENTEQEGGSGNTDKEPDGEKPGTGDEGENKPGDNTGDNRSGMTPGQHQQKLEETAIEFMSYFDAFDNKRWIDAYVALSNCMEENEDFPLDDMFGFGFEEEEFPVLEGNDTNGDGYADDFDGDGYPDDGFTRIFDWIEDADSEQYIVDLNLSSGKACSWDAENGEWVMGKTDDQSVKCSWSDGYAAVVTWSNSSKLYDLKLDYENYDEIFKVYIPSEIKLVISQNGGELISVTVKPNYTDKYTIAPNVSISTYAGYTLTSTNKADRTGISSEATFKKGSIELLSYNAAVAINDITDVDSWLAKHEDEWSDGYNEYVEEWYYMDADAAFRGAKTGSCRINILDISIAATGDFKGVVEEVYELDEIDGDKEWTDAFVNMVNERATAKAFYRGTNTALCDIVAQTGVREYEDYYYDEATGEIVYGVISDPEFEPIMVFEDGTKFSFGSFFTERKFKEAIEAFENLVNDFDDLYEDYWEEESVPSPVSFSANAGGTR